MTATRIRSLSRARARSEASWLRASLVVVWLLTAIASALEVNGRSAALLQHAGIVDPRWAAIALWGGVALDAVLGVLLWWRPVRSTFTLAIAATIAMTVLATVLDPGLWLDPFGALSKNLPILAALALLRGRTTS